MCRPAAGVFQQLLLFTLLVPDSVAKDVPDPCRSALLPGYSAVVIGAFDVSLLCVCSRIGPVSGSLEGLASRWHITACRPIGLPHILCTSHHVVLTVCKCMPTSEPILSTCASGTLL